MPVRREGVGAPVRRAGELRQPVYGSAALGECALPLLPASLLFHFGCLVR